MSGYVAECRQCGDLASGEMTAVVTWAAQHNTTTGHTTIAEPVAYERAGADQ
jgi:hypothetical protein